MDRPNVFLVGAPKCGTTSATQYLAAHPQVFVCSPRETFHFCTDLDIHRSMLVSDRQAYLKMFAEAGDARAVMDSSVWHLYSKDAAVNIKQFEPEAKILIMLRHPVDMMWSLHGWFLYTAAEDILDFEEALLAQDDRQAGKRIPPETVCPQALQYTDVVTFSPQVQRYYEQFGRERVKVVLFDDFVADTPGMYREMLEFIEVDSTFVPGFAVHGAAKAIRNPGIKQLLRRHRWLRLTVGRALPARLRGRIGRSIASVGPEHEQRATAMDPVLRDRLQQQFRAEIDRLGELIGRDLSHWQRQPSAAPSA